MDAVPLNRGSVTPILGALSLDGLVATMTVEGGTSGDVYVAFLEQVLPPHLKPGDLVVMDNAGAHKDPRVVPILAPVGARPVYLPPCPPHLNPIEWTWSKLKTLLRTARAQTVTALNTAIAIAMTMITPEDNAGWFRHRGYSGQPT